jgi:CBS domain-containing protein
MSTDLITIAPEQPMREAARLMHERSTQRLLVVDSNSKLVGIVTRGDIVRAMAADQG